MLLSIDDAHCRSALNISRISSHKCRLGSFRSGASATTANSKKTAIPANTNAVSEPESVNCWFSELDCEEWNRLCLCRAVLPVGVNLVRLKAKVLSESLHVSCFKPVLSEPDTMLDRWREL